ncbi:MAG: hypothetical protein AAF772_07005 [Acidobacteriota bacterium]
MTAAWVFGILAGYAIVWPIYPEGTALAPLSEDETLFIWDFRAGDLHHSMYDDVPAVQIQQDGTVWVYRHRFQKKPGWFSMKLSNQELQRLIEQIQASNIFELSGQQIRETADEARLLAIQGGRRNTFWTSSAIYLFRFYDRSQASTQVGMREVRLLDLFQYEKYYPEITSLKDAIAIARKMREIYRDPRLEAKSETTRPEE